MNGSSPQSELGPHEATLDATSLPGSASSSHSPKIRLHAGSSIELSSEDRAMLRSRLRAAALTLAVGSLAFLFYHFWAIRWEDPGASIVLSAHVAVTLLLGVCGVSLCRRCNLSNLMLRIKEAIVFGAPAAFFLTMQSFQLIKCADHEHVLPSLVDCWLVLIYTYALFIPNTWQRSLMVIAPMAAAPVLLATTMIGLNAVCANAVNANAMYVVKMAITMLVAASSSVIGLYCISRLRVEAFRARQLGHYRLKRQLGSGGMGEVYLGEHQLMKRPCAIKIIRPEKAGEATILARFEREVRATAQLSHHNTVDIYDYGRAEDGTFYYVMEFLPGLNLMEIVSAHGPLPPARAIHLIRQICDSLAEAHAMNVLHRDLKPANIFAAYRGGRHDVAKLLDFGLAKPLADTTDSPQLTQHGAINGSPLFMSPEQGTGKPVDARSDIYSLGCVLYYLLTGHAPFEEEGAINVILAHSMREPPPLDHWNADLPDDLQQVVSKCMAKAPQDRYARVEEVASALDACQDAGAWTARDARHWWTENVPDPPEATEADLELESVV